MVATNLGSGLIGRQSELDVLVHALGEAQSGERRTVLIEGVAGIGKSRLVEEVGRLAADTGMLVLEGAADRIEQHTPYRAWRTILHDLLSLDGAVDPAEQQRQVIEHLSAIDQSYADRASLLQDIVDLDLLETAATTKYPPDIRKESLAALVGAILAQRTSTGTLVLIVEDAHWLDSASWDLLVSVARSLIHRPVLLLITCQPLGDPRTEFTTLLELERTKYLVLGGLGIEETIAVAAQYLGAELSTLPLPVQLLIRKRCKGNPLYTIELVGALADRGLLIVDDGNFRLTSEEEDLDKILPDTLEGVVHSRLDQLSEDEQLTLKTASVLGQSFSLEVLRDVYPGKIDEQELRTHLSDMAHYRLATQAEEQREAVYAFQHVVTQEVAYDTTVSDQAHDLHRSVATWYEQNYAVHLGSHYTLLAFHWAGAGDQGKEFEYSHLAGVQSASQYANAEAEIYLSRAIVLVEEYGDDPDSHLGLLQHRARVRAFLGLVKEEKADLELLLDAVSVSKDAARRGEALLLWSDFHLRCGDFDESRTIAETAIEAMQAARESIGEARARLQIGKTLEGQGRFQEAREYVADAQDLLRGTTALDAQAAGAKTLGIIKARLGELPSAMEQFRAARELYRKLEDRKGEADILGNLGALDYYLGEYERSLDYTKQAQQLFHEMGNRSGSAGCLANLGSSYISLGAFAEGLRHHEQAYEIYEQLEDRHGCATSLNNMGIAHMLSCVGGLTSCAHGELPGLKKSLNTTSKALALFSEIGTLRGELECHFNLGVIFLAIGDSEVAKAHLDRALGLSRELGLNHFTQRAILALAQADLLLGDFESALVQSEEAMEQLGDQMPPDAVEMHYFHYLVLLANARKDNALKHLRIARDAIQEQSQSIHDSETRRSFLAMYSEVLEAWHRHFDTRQEPRS